MEGSSSKEKISLHDMTTYDDQLFNSGDTTERDDGSNRQCQCTFSSKRYMISILALLGFCNLYALRVNLSVALVAMVANNTVKNAEGKTVEKPPEFNWSSETQGVVLSSFFYGYMLTQLPGGYLSLKFGGKNLFGFGVMTTSIFTLFIPVATRANVALLIALRILTGLCEGFVYPANHAVWTKWAPPLERTKLATIAASGSYIGTVIAMPLSGVLSEQLGWPSVFYVFGTAGVVWAIVWFLLVKNSPSEDPNISEEERLYIENALRHDVQKKENIKVPWKEIFTSLPVWAIVVAHFSENWGFYTLLTELPNFLKHRLDFNLSKAGVVSALPYLVMAITIQAGGQIADCLRRKRILSTSVVRKLFNSFGFVCQGICLVIAGYTTNWIVAVVCLTLAVGGGGFAFSGFFVNHLDIAPSFAGILIGISNTVATLPGIISPLLTGVIVQHHSAGEWRLVFYIGGLIYIIGAIFYCLFSSGDKQPWATAYSSLPDEADEYEIEGR